jgi:hypothetical protein
VTTLPGLDIANTLPYRLPSLYVRARIASSDFNVCEAAWAFEILFEIPQGGKRTCFDAFS